MTEPGRDPFSDQALLTAYDRARNASALEQILSLLAAAGEPAPGALAIGDRDARLLDVFTKTFGNSFHGIADCPDCGEQLELTLEPAQIRVPAGDADQRFRLQMSPYKLVLRLPTSEDIRAAENTATLEQARRLLAERCVADAFEGDRAIEPAALPDDVLDSASETIAEHDLQADIRLQLVCPACSAEWEAPFDVGAFAWAELAARAERLLAEIHELASAYGWTETEILSLPASRRQRYLAFVRA